ncbi:MAG: hypothetical protein PWP23_2823 [Candidatus Sumerlaeota bacterium]|nr:hypothetical protein [Candidatus Sumerlaeota bacterium]
MNILRRTALACALIASTLPTLAPIALAGERVPAAEARALLATNGNDPAQSAGLFVGINDFDDPAVLDNAWAVDDAIDLAAAFHECGALDAANIRLVLAGEPKKPETAERLESLKEAGALVSPATLGAFVDLLDETPAHTGPGGTMIVFLGTHGFETARAGAVMLADSRQAYLPVTGLPLHTIREVMKTDEAHEHAARWLLLLDTGRERALAESSDDKPVKAANPMSKVFAESLGRDRHLAVLTATAPGQASREDAQRQQGLFAATIIDGLRGAAPTGSDGILQLTELADWAKENPSGEADETQTAYAILSSGTRDLALAAEKIDNTALEAFESEKKVLLKALDDIAADPRILDGAVRDEVHAALEAASPGSADALVANLQRLQREGATYADVFAAWWNNAGRDKFAASASSTGEPDCTTTIEQARELLDTIKEELNSQP